MPVQHQDPFAENSLRDEQALITQLERVLKAYARDAAGLTSNVLTSPTDSLRFYPVVNRPTTTPLQLSQYHEVKDIVYDAKRDLMYVAIATENNIAVFSPSSMTLQSPIALPAGTGGMDLS